VLFDACGAMLWAAVFVVIGYAAGANLSAVQAYWGSLTVLMQIAAAIAVVAFLTAKFVGATRVTIAIGAALLAVAAVRPAFSTSDELEAGSPRGRHDQAIVRMGGPDMAPHIPRRSSRPGEPVALLVTG
jgi:hypothetical protein